MTSWTQTQTRIVREAADLAPLKVLITILSAPFFVIGMLVALIWTIGALAWQAVWVGVSETRDKLKT